MRGKYPPLSNYETQGGLRKKKVGRGGRGAGIKQSGLGKKIGKKKRMGGVGLGEF